MTAVQANGITIEYEEMGPPDSPVILLIMGLGMQLIAWPESFCEGLAARGFRIVRFDNRDAGLSTRMPSVGSLATKAMMARALFGLPVKPPYTLDDMARERPEASAHDSAPSGWRSFDARNRRADSFDAPRARPWRGVRPPSADSRRRR